MAETRKLAAILVADVVGYTRLAGADEDRTLARLRELRSDVIDPTISVEIPPDPAEEAWRVGAHSRASNCEQFRSIVGLVTKNKPSRRFLRRLAASHRKVDASSFG
jgi:hypothetical protein